MLGRPGVHGLDDGTLVAQRLLHVRDAVHGDRVEAHLAHPAPCLQRAVSAAPASNTATAVPSTKTDMTPPRSELPIRRIARVGGALKPVNAGFNTSFGGMGTEQCWAHRWAPAPPWNGPRNADRRFPPRASALPMASTLAGLTNSQEQAP